MAKKKQRKSRRGYVPEDAYGNCFLAFWGEPEYDPYNPPQGRPDYLRVLLIHACYGFPRKKENHPQVNSYTAKELVKLASEKLKWRSNEGDTEQANKERQIRNVCRELGIQLRKAPLGRPRGESKSRKNPGS